MSRNVRFKTEKREGSVGNLKFAAAVIAAVAVLFSASLFFVLAKNDFDFRTALGGDPGATTRANEETEENAPGGERRYLLWGKDTETGTLRFIWLVKFEFPSRKVTVCAPSAGSTVTFNGTEISLSRVFDIFGEKGLKKAFEETYGFKLDGYIGSDTETFKQLINYFGSIRVELEEKVEYKGDFNLILMRGANTLKGDQLYKYLVYLEKSGDVAADERCDILLAIFDIVFREGRLSSMDNIYSKITNLLYSDITVVDYSGSSRLFKTLFKNGMDKTVTAEDPEDIG